MALNEISRPFQRWVFVSYAHCDESWMHRLRAHLKPLEKSCGCEVFWDGMLDTGDDWDEQITSQLHDANAAVLLISADFLASKYISENEFPTLLARTKEERGDFNVFPVFVGPCCFEEVTFEYTRPDKRKEQRSLASVMAANDPANPLVCQTPCQQEETFARVARSIAAWFRELDHAPVTPKPMVPKSTQHIDVSRMPRTSSLFVGRNSELKKLESSFSEKETALCTIVAQGGEGKSALVSHWMRRLERENWKDARAFAWSFYSQGTRRLSASADEFMFEALKFFGDPHPHDGPPEAKGERLAELMRKKPTLLVLDGLEPLQDNDGIIQDEAVASLVKILATTKTSKKNEGLLCVITTRQSVNRKKHLDKKRDNSIELKSLSERDGAHLLKLHGVGGSQRMRENLSYEVNGHPLSLLLMGTYRRDIGTPNSNEAAESYLPVRSSTTDHASTWISHYEIYFKDQPHRDVLRILGLFDRPATPDEILALYEKGIPGLTDRVARISDESQLQSIIIRLQRAGLVNESTIDNIGGLDAHPLIREYFANRVRKMPDGVWKTGHSTLYKHLSSRTEGSQAGTLQEMLPFYQAMHHAALANRLPKALKHVYWKHIQQGQLGYSHRRFGAFQTEVNMLRECFENPWTKPVPNLGSFWHPAIFGIAGSRLRALGRLDEAIEPLKMSLHLHESAGHILYAGIRARHLSELYLEIGQIKEAISFGKKAIELTAKRGSDGKRALKDYRHAGIGDVDSNNMKYEKLVAYTVHGAAQHQTNLQKAITSFNAARKQVVDTPPWGSVTSLFGLWGFRYCECLIDAIKWAKCKKERTQFNKDLKTQIQEMKSILSEDIIKYVPEGDLGLLGPTLVELVTIRAEHLKSNKPTHALVERAKQVAEDLRKGKRRDFIPLGVLNYIEVARSHAEQFRTAKSDRKAAFDELMKELQNVKKIVKDSGMKLYAVDCLIEQGWLCTYARKHKKARKACRKAAQKLENLDSLPRRNSLIQLERQLRIKRGK